MSCDKPQTDRITVLVDLTDEAIPKPEQGGMFSALGFDDNKWVGGEIRRVDISDVQYGFSETIAIPAGNSLEGNEFERKKTLEQFKGKVANLLHFDEKQDYKKSVIFPIIIRELNTLCTIEGGKRKMFIFSDMIENTREVSLSKIDTKQLLPQHYGEIWDKMTESYGISLAENLSGIEVTIVYKAKDFDDSQRFSLVARMYQSELTKRGAVVTITGKL